MASDQVKERIEVAKAESARLERRLRELSDDDLRRPSACDHWEVADVVAHLAFAAQFQARMITRGLEGDDSIPEGARRQESEGTPASGTGFWILFTSAIKNWANFSTPLAPTTTTSPAGILGATPTYPTSWTWQ